LQKDTLRLNNQNKQTKTNNKHKNKAGHLLFLLVEIVCYPNNKITNGMKINVGLCLWQTNGSQ